MKRSAEDRTWRKWGYYRGVLVEHRPAMQRRSWRIHTNAEIGSSRPGVQVFNSRQAAERNIDGRLQRAGLTKASQAEGDEHE